MTENVTDFDKLYADEFQCPYCKEPFNFVRNRNKETQELAFRRLRRSMMLMHVEKYHTDKLHEFPDYVD